MSEQVEMTTSASRSVEVAPNQFVIDMRPVADPRIISVGPQGATIDMRPAPHSLNNPQISVPVRSVYVPLTRCQRVGEVCCTEMLQVFWFCFFIIGFLATIITVLVLYAPNRDGDGGTVVILPIGRGVE